MTTPREPHRGPFEERERSTRTGSGLPGRPRVGGPPGGPRPVPPQRVKPAWYRRPLPEVRRPRLPLLIGLGVLVVIGVAVAVVLSVAGGGKGTGTAVAAPASTRPVPTASAPAGPGIGTALAVVQERRRVGTVTLLRLKAVSMVTGTPPTAGSFIAFQVRFSAAGGSLYGSPLDFSVPGASDGPVLNGGAEPSLSNIALDDGRQITAYVTIQAPPHGRLYFAADPSQAPTQSWTY